MSKRGASPKRKGKSFEDLKNFNILAFLGGGVGSVSTGGSTYTPKRQFNQYGLTDRVTTKQRVYHGVTFDVFTKFPLFRKSSKPHYPIFDLPTNMGIVRTRGRSIDSAELRIKKMKDEIKSFGGKKDKRTLNKIQNRKDKIELEKSKIQSYKHEMDYRLKFLNEIRKKIDISDKGSLVKPYGKYTSYYFRIYWWGKKVPVYLGKEENLKLGFKNQDKFKDFDEYLKDYGRKLFLQKLGKEESTYSKAQRKLRRYVK